MALEWIHTRLARTPAYECAHCTLSFEDERLNCPACGFPVEEAA